MLTRRQRRALLRNSLVFAAFATLAVLLGTPARADDVRVVEGFGFSRIIAEQR